MIDKINMTLKKFKAENKDYLLSSFSFRKTTDYGKDELGFDNNNKAAVFSKESGFDDLYIKIDEKANKVNLELSLHKYFNYLINKRLDNSTPFGCTQATETLHNLENTLKLDLLDAKVTYYEIGVNLAMSKDPLEYLSKVKTILTDKYIKKIYINPKVKGERCMSTEFDKDKRRVYKLYDKTFEMQCKRKPYQPEGNILRVETVYKNVNKLTVKELFHPVFLLERVKTFESDIGTIVFDREYTKPEGLTPMEFETAKTIVSDFLGNGLKALEFYRKQLIDAKITEKQFRTRREFIQHKWQSVKNKVISIQSPEEREFRQLFKNAIYENSMYLNIRPL